MEKFELFYSKLSEYSQQPISELISDEDMSLVRAYWNEHGSYLRVKSYRNILTQIFTFLKSTGAISFRCFLKNPF